MSYFNNALTTQLKPDEISVWLSSDKLPRVQVGAIKSD